MRLHFFPSGILWPTSRSGPTFRSGPRSPCCGAQPRESAGSFPALDQLVDAVRGNPVARSLLEDGNPGSILERLQATPGAVGQAATDYLDIVGYRLLDSLDTGDSYALEVPGTLVDSIKRAVDDGAPAASQPPKSEIAALRDLVPAKHREAFDDLLTQARRCRGCATSAAFTATSGRAASLARRFWRVGGAW